MTFRPRALAKAELARHPLPPVRSGDKHDHGHLLLIAGSRDVPGSALLAAMAAMRAGAGTLRIATVDSAAAGLALAMPEAMVLGLPQARDGGFARAATMRLETLIDEADTIVAGPGMVANSVADRLAALLCRSGKPAVLDAALLRVLPRRRHDAESAAVSPILLPNAGELAALLGYDKEAVEADPLSSGRACAKRYDAIVLAKGVQSYVVVPGGRAWIYRGGGPGLGVSGSGDVLAGIVGGLLARGAGPLAALLWAVWLHGEAGAALGRRIGKLGFLARELPGEIPALLPA